MVDDREQAHHDLTRRFIAAIFIAIVGAIVALGVFAISYASPGGGGKILALVIVVVSVAAAVVGGVFAAIYAGRIGRLNARR